MENVENNIDELCPTVEGEIDAPEVIFTSEAESYLTGDIITPQMFGAKADGVTDDSEAIKAAIAALPRKGGTLYFPPGVYIHGDGKLDTDTEKGTGNSYDYVGGNLPYRPNVYQVEEGGQTQYKAVVNKEIKDITEVGRDIRFYFGPNEKGENYENLTILGYGAEIRSNDNNGQNRNNAMFMFVNCVGLKIKGLKLDGRRQERGVDQDDHIPGPINEFLQCNITVAYGCRDILIEDVTSVNSVHDGISIGWTVDNVKILNCVCDNAQRNGIAICGCKNVIIEGCQCNGSGISGDGYRGIAPKCGIDIEGHYSTHPNVNVNVHVSNCTIENNVTQGICVARWANTVTIDRCYFKNNQTVVYDIHEKREVENTYLTNSTLINSPLHTGFTLAENNYVENHYVPNNPYLSNGYSYTDWDDRDDTENICRNNTFKFVVDDESVIKGDEYMGIRLVKKMRFIGNRVIGAFSVNEKSYPIWLRNAYATDNVFERTYTALNGIEISGSPKNTIHSLFNYSDGHYRANNDFGEYEIHGLKDMNQTSSTDTSITKSYYFGSAQKDKWYRIRNLGITKITAYYSSRVEEIIFPAWDFNKIQHILKHEANLSDSTTGTILTVYIQYPYIYINVNCPSPMFTVTRHSDYYGNINTIFDEELMVDVTDDVNAGTISIPSNVAIHMIRHYGNNTSRPTYGHLDIGTMYYDTSLKKPLWWDGEKWLDKDGNDLGDFIGFTVDGVTCITRRGMTFAQWVKTKYNDLGIRVADGDGTGAVVSADGNKTLYVVHNGNEVAFNGHYTIYDINAETNPGIYFWKDTPGVNPDYSKCPVFWNGTELVTTPIYNGEVE